MYKNKRLECLFYFYIFLILAVCLTLFYLEQSSSADKVILQGNIFDYDSSQLFNLKNFTYLLESERCLYGTFAVLIVTSYAGDIETRSAVRNAYSTRVLENLGIKRVFLLALIDEARNFNNVQQAAIVAENERYDDIVQGNFIENYRNLTYKHIMGLRWATQNCNRVPFIIKMDHDIAVDLFSVIKMLKRLPKKDITLAGYVMENMKVIREPANKWFVSESEFQPDIYPDFLSGWLYITNPFTANLLTEASMSMPYFWIDDFYVTGALTHKLNLPLVKLNKYFTTHPNHLQCCIMEPKLECDFWVGPNGGDNRILINFERYSEACFKGNCKKRPQGKSVRETCQVNGTN